MASVHIVLNNKLSDGSYQEIEILDANYVKIEGPWLYVDGDLNGSMENEIIGTLVSMFKLSDIIGYYMEDM